MMECDGDGCTKDSDWGLEADYMGGDSWFFCTDCLREFIDNYSSE